MRIVKNLCQAFGKGDVAAVLGAMDEKIQWMVAAVAADRHLRELRTGRPRLGTSHGLHGGDA